MPGQYTAAVETASGSAPASQLLIKLLEANMPCAVAQIQLPVAHKLCRDNTLLHSLTAASEPFL